MMTENHEDVFLRLSAVRAMVPLSRAHIYRLVARGDFPAPIKLSAQASAWSKNAIREWMRDRVSQSTSVEAA